jgi:flavin-dependent dehydrogenase
LDSLTANVGVVTHTSTFEAGDATGAITEAGIFNAASGGQMLARTVFPAVNKSSTDTLAITWVVTISV